MKVMLVLILQMKAYQFAYSLVHQPNDVWGVIYILPRNQRGYWTQQRMAMENGTEGPEEDLPVVIAYKMMLPDDYDDESSGDGA